jgi:hypothetical protein
MKQGPRQGVGGASEVGQGVTDHPRFGRDLSQVRALLILAVIGTHYLTQHAQQRSSLHAAICGRDGEKIWSCRFSSHGLAYWGKGWRN